MVRIPAKTRIRKEIYVPPDKSISHRALIISSLARARTVIKPFLESEDTLATLDCIKRLGVKVERLKDNSLAVNGSGKYFPRKTKAILNAEESGTTIRILSGLLCAQRFPVIFNAKPSLRRRPMQRIIVPLRAMGADIAGVAKKNNEYPPLCIKPVKKITGGKFYLKQASAQVKSALIFASMYADGATLISEPFLSRDHTERMLALFGMDVSRRQHQVLCRPGTRLKSPSRLLIPGDFSSAAFFIVLGLICKKSELLIKKVNINHTRSGLLRVLERMGADITILDRTNAYEPYADILVKTSCLRGTVVERREIPGMIDEIPILCVAAAFAKGKTVIFGVEELKVKETDRIHSVVTNLKKAGVSVWSGPSGDKNGESIVIEGGVHPKKTSFLSFCDHRTAMSMIVFAAACGRNCTIDNVGCLNKSFPEFMAVFKSL